MELWGISAPTQNTHTDTHSYSPVTFLSTHTCIYTFYVISLPPFFTLLFNIWVAELVGLTKKQQHKKRFRNPNLKLFLLFSLINH